MSQKKRFKRISSLLCAVILAFTVAFSVPVASSAVSSAPARSSTLNKASNRPKLSATSKKIYYKATYTLKLLNNKKSVKWSTSNAKVAKVSPKGVVTGVGLGSAYIYAKAGSKTYKCKITVIDRNQKATVSLKTTDGGIFLYGTNSVTASFVLKSYSVAKATAYIVNTDGSSVYKKTFTNVKKGTTYKFNWNGKKSNGKVVPAGSYRMKVVVGTTNTYSSYISFKTKNDFSGGNGSKNNPFLISNASQLSKIIKYPKSYYKQTANIDFNYSGINGMFSEDSPFNGVYDGGGKTIKNMIANSPVFNYIGEKGTVKNLNFRNCSTVAKFSAILADNNYGKISNCNFSECAITANDRGDGGIIAATNYGYITDCSASGVSNGSGSENYIGGIVGFNHETGKIINCVSTVNVSDVGNESWDFIGGITGVNHGIITNCEASGSLSDNRRVGGISGQNRGTITASYYTGSTNCNLVGENLGVVMQ